MKNTLLNFAMGVFGIRVERTSKAHPGGVYTGNEPVKLPGANRRSIPLSQVIATEIKSLTDLDIQVVPFPSTTGGMIYNVVIPEDHPQKSVLLGLIPTLQRMAKRRVDMVNKELKEEHKKAIAGWKAVETTAGGPTKSKAPELKVCAAPIVEATHKHPMFHARAHEDLMIEVEKKEAAKIK